MTNEADSGVPVTQATVDLAALLKRIDDLERKAASLESPGGTSTATSTAPTSKSADNQVNKSSDSKEPAGTDESHQSGDAATTKTSKKPWWTKIQRRKGLWNAEKGEREFLPLPEDHSVEPAEDKLHSQIPFRLDSATGTNLFAFWINATTAVYKTIVDLLHPGSIPDVDLRDGHLVIDGPMPLVRIRGGIEKEIAKLQGENLSDENQQCHDQLCVLLELYDRESILKEAFTKFNTMKKLGRIDWKHLKALYRLDEPVVYRAFRDQWAVGNVTSVVIDSDLDSPDSYTSLYVVFNTVDSDGKDFKYVEEFKKLEVFHGEKPICELPLYPLEFAPADQKKELEGLIESGKRWRDIHVDKLKSGSALCSTVMEYHGYYEKLPDEFDSGSYPGSTEKPPVGGYTSSRVIIDPTQYPSRQLKYAPGGEFLDLLTNPDPKKQKELNELFQMCPVKVYVYSLSDNEWYYVAFKDLGKTRWVGKKVWDRMVPNKDNEMQIDRLKRLSAAHRKRNEATLISDRPLIDNFKGKGQGLTILLYGPPGVGKTMLAECLSEHQERPLYRVDLGRLTEDTGRREARIEETFRQAHFWNAILLFDEAEVILAERTQENMRQSAWVAVFLRKIEYFEGLLFLTTNQIHFIDEAFESRITLGIQFHQMDADTRFRLWRLTLKDMTEGEKGSNRLYEDEEQIKKWASNLYPLNGRQIRNVVQSASMLAKYGEDGTSKPLTANGVQESLDSVMSFVHVIETEKEKERNSYLESWD